MRCFGLRSSALVATLPLTLGLAACGSDDARTEQSSRIDPTMTAEVVIPETTSTDTTQQTRAMRWRPQPGLSWQWQLQGAIDTSIDVPVYGIDLFDAPDEVLDALKARGVKTICYFSAGSYEEWRDDAKTFPESVLGAPLDGWPGERWLDIRQLDELRPIMQARVDLCRQRGFDAIEPDNIDGYANESGFPLDSADQLAYNKMLATMAHDAGLAIALKNDLDQVAELVDDFDFAINEECYTYDECNLLKPFIDANKAVFIVEYQDGWRAHCADAATNRFDLMGKSLELKSERETC